MMSLISRLDNNQHNVAMMGLGAWSERRKIALVWYKKKKEGKNTLSKSERKTVLLLASFIPG